MSEVDFGVTVRDVLSLLFRHKGKITAILLAGFALTVCLIDLETVSFRSEAKLLVRIGHESVAFDPTATIGKTMSVSVSRKAEINSELEILRSIELAETLVETIGPSELLGKTTAPAVEEPTRPPTLWREVTDRLRVVLRAVQKLRRGGEVSADAKRALIVLLRSLKFEAIEESHIIRVTYDSHNARLSQRVVSNFLRLYENKHIEVHQDQGSYSFFNRQFLNAENELHRGEDELMNAKNELGISSVEEHRKMLVERIGRLRRESSLNETELAASTSKVASLRQALSRIPRTLETKITGLPNAVADTMRQRIFDLQIEERGLSFSGDVQQVQKARLTREWAEDRVREEGRSCTEKREMLNATFLQLETAVLTEEANVASLSTRSESIRAQALATQGALRQFHEVELRLTRLERKVELGRLNHQTYAANFEQTRVTHALERDKISNISVIQPATLPIQAMRVRRFMYLAVGVCLSLGAAIGLALLSEQADRSIRTPEGVEARLGLPSLSCIPIVPLLTRCLLPLKTVRRRLPKAIGRPQNEGRGVGLSQRLQTACVSLREHVVQLASKFAGDGGYVLGVIGSRRGEGVTTVAATLARLLASDGPGRIVLVDANVDHPGVHKLFRQPLTPGLFDALHGKSLNGQRLACRSVGNLSIMSAGTRGDEADFWSTARFQSLIEKLRSAGQVVVVDLPAVGDGSHATALAGCCDDVLLVVEAEGPRWDLARNAKEELVKWNSKIAGVVLNKHRHTIPRWLDRIV